MKRKTVAIPVVISVLVAALLGADHLGFLGTRSEIRLDFAIARFKTKDSDTGAPVFGARVKCQQKGNDNACTLKDKRSRDKLSLLFPRRTEVTRSWLFTLKEELQVPEHRDVHIFFIHPDYETVNITVPIIDILQNRFAQQTINMKARKW